MANFRATLVSAGFVLVTAFFALTQRFLLLVRAPAADWYLIYYHRAVARLLGMRIERRGQIDPRRPLMIVSNHAGWLDIFIIGSLGPLSFVAKREIAGWPIFGWLTTLQRSIYIDRTSRKGTRLANEQTTERLKSGDAIVLFAEGTSSDGNRILPFKSAIVGAAEGALRSSDFEEVYVQPLAVTYTKRYGLPLSRRERSAYAWYGDMDLLPHFWEVARSGPFNAAVTFGEAYPLTRFANRKELTRQLERDVRRMFTACMSGREGARERDPAPAATSAAPRP